MTKKRAAGSLASGGVFGPGRFCVKGHIWIEGPAGAFLGAGRIVLLEKIRELGSIRAAAKSIRMSYRRAWELVESMNAQSGVPLVMAATGGRGGGGAYLTEAGVLAIEVFKSIDANFRRFAVSVGRGRQKVR